jgi:hypothetical protein
MSSNVKSGWCIQVGGNSPRPVITSVAPVPSQVEGKQSRARQTGDCFPGLTARTGVTGVPRNDRQAQPGVSTENDTPLKSGREEKAPIETGTRRQGRVLVRKAHPPQQRRTRAIPLVTTAAKPTTASANQPPPAAASQFLVRNRSSHPCEGCAELGCQRVLS